MSSPLLYNIGITLIPGVGDVNGKKLIAYCGGAEAVFREKRKNLEKIPGIGSYTVQCIVNQKVLDRAEQEIAFIEKYDIRPLFYLDSGYPKRLQHCADSPMMLYYKGNADLNEQRIIGVVGTRNPTEYGKVFCENLIHELQSMEVLVVSGLAYGIDSCAHRSALTVGLQTVGVLAHGLDRIYPYTNKAMAERMLSQGGLVTEFMSQTKPDRENFPQRNRVVAGLCDALVVVESAKKGGALITADIANSYNRDVFAVPGRVGDMFSEGCNYLIRTNRAALLEQAANIRYLMGWEEGARLSSPQKKLFREFSAEEQALVDILQTEKEAGIDDMMIKSQYPASKIASLLLTLEFDGIVAALPGKRFRLL